MSDEDVGTVYLLHFDGELGPAGNSRNRASHYVGWYRSPTRIDHHRNGTSDVAIVNAFLSAGFGFVIARTRVGTRNDERRIKNAGGQRRYCPVCTIWHRNGVWKEATDALVG
jgi:hypothetical protein